MSSYDTGDEGWGTTSKSGAELAAEEAAEEAAKAAAKADAKIKGKPEADRYIRILNTEYKEYTKVNDTDEFKLYINTIFEKFFPTVDNTEAKSISEDIPMYLNQYLSHRNNFYRFLVCLKDRKIYNNTENKYTENKYTDCYKTIKNLIMDFNFTFKTDPLDIFSYTAESGEKFNSYFLFQDISRYSSNVINKLDTVFKNKRVIRQLYNVDSITNMIENQSGYGIIKYYTNYQFEYDLNNENDRTKVNNMYTNIHYIYFQIMLQIINKLYLMANRTDDCMERFKTTMDKILKCVEEMRKKESTQGGRRTRKNKYRKTKKRNTKKQKRSKRKTKKYRKQRQW
jgi:hypothetical protein